MQTDIICISLHPIYPLNRRIKMVELKGFEPSTYAMRTRRSTKLSYSPTFN